ncbi:hypothetical protein AMELA_G00082910 [Ameiurus melas]|uniref:Uncharacterized protein n=1 Tax=Ameiurus melas TaxID=219545 RepID=A0A7J6B0J2_AMEME|nr:hypothetical protein AMELA_G00082910 [Ameiurus melas]
MPEVASSVWWLISICTLVLFISAGEGSKCYAKKHPNGTMTFYLNETEPESQHYSWRINGIVHGNENTFNNTTIESRGPRYVNFKSCYENVTYWRIRTGKTINCPYNCSTEPLPKGLLLQSNVNVVGCAVGILSAVVLAVCIVIVWKRQELQRCFQNIRDSWYRWDYRQAGHQHAV